MNVLLIVEGETEREILGYILPKYGFNEIIIDELICKDKDFTNYSFSDTKDNIVVIEGPKNRIKDVVKNLNDTDDFYKNFVHPSIKFSGIFLIYDVDHNSDSIIREGFDKLIDESTGLLLLNCPCIEVLGDVKREEFECKHLSEYKTYLNNYHATNKLTTKSYIKMNFNDILISFLEQNYKEILKENLSWKPSNIMLHPEYLIQLNEKNNIRMGENDDNYYCKIRYFSTVIYVFLAFVKGFSKHFNSYELLLNYLYEVRKNEENEDYMHITKLVDENKYSEREFSNKLGDEVYAKKIFLKMEKEKIISKRKKGKPREFLMSKYKKN